jgi:eukaryotic-like serine/threonine-protein kinase
MLLGGQFAEPQARARFRSEAEITAQLQHPNIVAIHEVGEHDHLPFFTMDYVEGRSLAEVARDKPLTPARRQVTCRSSPGRSLMPMNTACCIGI